MGVVTRLAARKARKNGTKVMYMVHGFHFYKGAPKKYWLAFYPIEKLASHLCDEIVTINKEDYERAKTFPTKEVRYIHGIGVDTSRLKPDNIQCDIREEIGLSENTFLILSVGELLPRKNQQVIIRALGLLKDEDIHYILCGKGNQLDELQKLAEQQHVEKQVHFLGYRKDILNIYGQTDLLAFPSMREGLGLAGLEAMYCGLPLVTSNTSGPRDFMENGKTGYMFDPYDAEGFAKGIEELKRNTELRKNCGEYNQKAVIPYYIENVKKEVLELVEEF
jgi:glycosyltransferase EpsD